MPNDTSDQSIWNAPRGATYAPLDQAMRSVERERVPELQRQALQDVRDRAEAYRTPVTEETLRRSLP